MIKRRNMTGGLADRNLKPDGRTSQNMIYALQLLVVMPDGSEKMEFFSVATAINAMGKSIENDEVTYSHLDGRSDSTYIVGTNTSFTITGRYSPEDPVNAILSKFGWEAKPNQKTRMLEIFAQEEYMKVNTDGTLEVGTFEANLMDVSVTPKSPMADAKDMLNIEIAVTVEGSPEKTWATVDEQTKRWVVTGGEREGSRFAVYQDEEGNLSLTPPSETPTETMGVMFP